jgi:hypothetical protein
MLTKPYWYLVCTCIMILTACTSPSGSGQSQVPAGVTTNATALPNQPPASCSITSQPGTAFTPPAPYPPTPPAAYTGQFWYGTADLWTMLRTDGTWTGLPQSNAGYTQKVFWWNQGYDMSAEPTPDLTVTGKRLDGSAPALLASNATDAEADFGQAMLVGIEVPTPGCWQITGHYKGHELSFVVWVSP